MAVATFVFQWSIPFYSIFNIYIKLLTKQSQDGRHSQAYVFRMKLISQDGRHSQDGQRLTPMPIRLKNYALICLWFMEEDTLKNYILSSKDIVVRFFDLVI